MHDCMYQLHNKMDNIWITSGVFHIDGTVSAYYSVLNYLDYCLICVKMLGRNINFIKYFKAIRVFGN